MRLLEGCSTLYTGSAFRVSVIGAKLVYLSITSKQARVAPECCHAVVTPYKRLGKISDILHLNNKNNQLKRRVRPPQRYLLDAQSWTRAYDLSSRVVAVTTTTETS